MHMKHFVLSLILIVTSQLVLPYQSFAQDIPEDEEGDEIVIINEDLFGNGPARDILPVPINATLFRLACCIEVEFFSNIGEVTIQLTNLSNSASVNMVIDSNIGSCIIPVTSGTGIYRIEFITMEGTQFYGLFILI